MKSTFVRVAAAATFACAAPLLAVSALADEPGEGVESQPVVEGAEPAGERPVQPAQSADTAPEVPAAPAQEAPAVEEEAEEERVICRSIRLDASSRRKTRVCRTAEGWRELNQRR